jgi:hypothetical protein
MFAVGAGELPKTFPKYGLSKILGLAPRARHLLVILATRAIAAAKTV